MSKHQQDKAGLPLVITRRYLDDYYSKTPEGIKAYEEFTALRSILLMSFPFWGVLSMNLKYVEAYWVRTLATDGFHVYVNPTFLARLKDGERLRGIAHEIYHCVWNHVPLVIEGAIIDRKGDRDNEFWNIACDHNDNLELAEARIGSDFTTIQVYQDPKYQGWMVEEIYDDLVQQGDAAKDPNKEFDQHIQAQPGDDGEGGDDGDQDQDQDDGQDDGDGDGDQDGGKPGQKGAQKGAGGDQPGKGGAGQPGDQNGPGGPGDDLTAPITAQDIADMQQSWKETLQRAVAAQEYAEAQGRGAGGIPGSMRLLIDSLKEPVFDWKDKLRAYLEERMSDEDYSFHMPDVAFFNDGYTMEGIGAPEDTLTDAFVWADVSGSTLSMLREFFSEFWGIMEAFNSFNLRAGTFDARVHEDKVREFDENSKFEYDDWVQTLEGGGGTVFPVIYEYMKERGIRPRLNIVFTDGDPLGEDWGDPDYCLTIFIIVGNPHKTAPHGVTLHYEAPTK